MTKIKYRLRNDKISKNEIRNLLADRQVKTKNETLSTTATTELTIE
jgi:hypothetical protein